MQHVALGAARVEHAAGAEHVPAHRALIEARIALARGDLDKAIERFEEGIRLWPDNPDARYLAAHAKPQVSGSVSITGYDGVTDPETKRKIIGRVFIEVFEEEAKKIVPRPEDIAEACLFLASSRRAGFITGQNLVVDGGMTRRMIYLE